MSVIDCVVYNSPFVEVGMTSILPGRFMEFVGRLIDYAIESDSSLVAVDATVREGNWDMPTPMDSPAFDKPEFHMGCSWGVEIGACPVRIV